MSTLLLRLAGPMQSWGTRSRFTVRDTEKDPSKSGVIGLVCAAMGISRDDTEMIQQFAELRMSVREDREGIVARDFQTAGGGSWPGGKKYGVIKSDGGTPDTIISHRYYLADADFLVALEGKKDLLQKIHKYLKNPVWPLYLGRKSYIPGKPIYIPDGLFTGTAEEVLYSYPYQKREDCELPDALRLIVECGLNEGQRRLDQPVCFVQGRRKFLSRFVRVDWIKLNRLVII